MTPYEFLAVFTFSCIIFTLIVKALTFSSVVNKMKLADLSTPDEYTMHQVKDLIDKKMIFILNYLK
jgi:NhaP-type Na+/H+ or K+/H+ antiporter